MHKSGGGGSPGASDLAALFGLADEACAAADLAELPDLSAEIVAFMQATERGAAANYARLTRRSCARFETTEAALDDPRVAVLVLRFAELTARALAAIASSSFDPRRTAAVGVVLTTDAADQPFDYSVFASAYRLSLAAPSGPRTVLLPWLPGELYDAGNDGLIVAADVPPATLRAVLSRDNALTTIGGHSDGIDLQLAQGASMCGIRRWPASMPGQVVPRCRQRSWCHRRKLPLAEAVSAPTVIGPEALRSRVVLLDSCFGIPFSDRLFHRSFSLFHALLTGSRFGALITHGEVIFLDLDNTERVGDALRHPSGIGYGLVSHLSQTRERGDRPILFGDPALVLRTGDRLILSPRQADRTDDKRPLFSARDPARSFFAAVLAGKGQSAVAAAIEDKLLGWLVNEGKVEDLWVPRAGVSTAGPGPDCAACGTPTRLFVSRAGVLPDQRHLVLCPVCGVIADRRSTETALLRHASPSVYSLTSAFRQPVRAAALRFESAGKAESGPPYGVGSVPWPVSAGVPHPSIRLAAALLPGMNRIMGIFVHDEDVTVLTMLQVG
jgi:hypothetical protein